MNDSVRRLVFPVLVVAVFGLSYLTANRPNEPAKSSTIQVEVVPSGTSVKLDGGGIKTGKINVTAANHMIVAEKSGFSPVRKSVSAKAGQTTYVGIVLQPDTDGTRSWYAQHPDDAHAAEGVGSHAADFLNQSVAQQNPLLAQMPIIYGDGQRGLVNIAPGVPVQAGGPPALYIDTESPSARQGALTYLTNHGLDPATVDIVFSNQSNPLEQSGD